MLSVLIGIGALGRIAVGAVPGEPSSARAVVDAVKAGRFSGRPIDLSRSNADLAAVFAALQDASGFAFDVDPAVRVRVTYDFRQRPWDEILARVLADHRLRLSPDPQDRGFKVHRGAAYVLAFDSPLKARLAAFLFRNAAPLAALGALLLAAALVGVWTRQRGAARRPGARKALLTADRAEDARQDLFRLFREERLHFRESLSLGEVAGRLGVTPHQLSWLVNDVLHTSFASLVNGYRVEEARRRLADPSGGSASMLDIGLAVGFGGKAAFNRAFKKQTGMTPSDYRSAAQREAPGSLAG